VHSISSAMERHISYVANKFSQHLTPCWLLISTEKQSMYLINVDTIEKDYSISTSMYGVGSEQDSFKTPPGAHVVAQKIGEHCELNEILRGRQATGECADIIYQAKSSQEDLILSRILWLKGLEKGKNFGQGVDSYQRYIYIHGTQEEGLIGTPASHGCVRMLNKDIIEIFERINEGTFVYIV